ncbi:MAG TPA: hypothetical protein VJ728_05955 [Candidatus Binataceae bacterium]|nr:hypothetical protein [Candidatus Binataceae bacterium]
MRWASVLVAVGLSAIQFAACQRKSFDPASANTFFPLRPGLSWTYRIKDRRRGPVHFLTDRVVRRTMVGTGERAEVESKYSGPNGSVSSTIVYFTEHGYFTRQSRTDHGPGVALAEQSFLPLLLEPNLTWSNSLVPFDRLEDAFDINQTHHTFFEPATINVPAGHFSGCIRIETKAVYQNRSGVSSPAELEYIDWYAPHIGLVKTVVEQRGIFGTELARIELLTFSYSQLPSPASVSAVPWQIHPQGRSP